MPDVRTDWLTGRTVLIAENRAFRPNEFAPAPQSLRIPDGEAASAAARASATAYCPFCPGNEFNTPAAEYEKLNAEGRWLVRVVANKYPALSLDCDASIASGGPLMSPSGLNASQCTASMPAFGAHEVIVESSRHVDRTSALTPIEIRDVLETYASRLHHWRNDGRFAYGLVFKNQGPRAGASIAHLHSQLVALPTAPSAVDAEVSRAKQIHNETSACAYCALLEEERRNANRIIFADDRFIAWCPFASLQPCETWIMPALHQPSFELAMDDASVEQLSQVLHTLVTRLERILPEASYNLLLRTAPWTGDCNRSYHWRIELVPRLNAVAGLESATGIFINPVAPERAAAELRSRK
jgi:UDPglucose--hexose-1-phosphate uridylyltransferase